MCSPSTLSCLLDTPTTRTPLLMGTGSPITKVINQAGVFVERGFDSHLSATEIHNERQITLWASKHGIAPKVHSADSTLIIMDWIEGTHVKSLSLDQIADLARNFKKMHSLPIPENISLPKQSHFVDWFLKVESQMEEKTLIPSYLSTIKLQLLENLKNEAETKLVLCHGDVHANNVLWRKNELFFIDWTCAGLDYPIVDLSVASMFWIFKMPTRRSFEEYRTALFDGTFSSIMRDFDDWVDVHLARIQSSGLI